MAANKHFIIFFSIFLILISSVYSTKVDINIDETTTLTKLFNSKYSLQTNGVLTIYNPSNVSKIYEANFPIELDSLVGISKKNVDSSSDKFDFTYNNIKGYIIGPNETIKVGYNIFGILDYNIYNRLDKDESVFEYYVKDFNLVSKLVLNLNKPQREGFYNELDGNITDKTQGVETQRLISAEIRNPTDFDYTINELKLYRTGVSDPMFGDGRVIKTYTNMSIDPFEYKLLDFFDTFSDDRSVYWISSDLYIKNIFTSKVVKNYQEEIRDTTAGTGDSFLPSINSSLIVKKETDKTLIQEGEEFRVILRIVNPTNYVLNNLTLYDEAPEGYQIDEVSHEVKISKGSLTFRIDKLDAYGTYVIEYTLIPKKDFKGITYLKPAKLVYKQNEYFSEGVLIINGLLPNEKVFVQKEIKYIDENFAQVTIRVKNLGNYLLENILVSDDMDEDAILKEISKVFYERGVWKIKMLKPGEEWEVTYLITRNSKLDTLPNIFGVDKLDVYGTLVSSEEIVTLFKEEPRIIEKVGMSLAVGFLIIYLLF